MSSIGEKLDLSPAAIIEAIEANLTDSSTVLGRTDEGVVFRGSDVTWVYSGYSGLSRVMDARFTPENVEDRVTETLGYFKQWDASVSWVTGPRSWPLGLSETLRKNGFGSGESWTGLAMDLASLQPLDLMPPGLTINAVTDKPGMLAWANLSAEVIAGEDDSAIEVFAPANAGGDARCKYYIGSIDGHAIARAMSFTNGDSIGIYWLTTTAAFSGKGIGKAVAHKALQDARDGGARLAVVSTVGGGADLFRSIGFKSHCQFNVYHWPPLPLPMPTF